MAKLGSDMWVVIKMLEDMSKFLNEINTQIKIKENEKEVIMNKQTGIKHYVVSTSVVSNEIGAYNWGAGYTNGKKYLRSREYMTCACGYRTDKSDDMQEHIEKRNEKQNE